MNCRVQGLVNICVLHFSNERPYFFPDPWKHLVGALIKEGEAYCVLEIDLVESELRKKVGEHNLRNNLTFIYSYFMVCHEA